MVDQTLSAYWDTIPNDKNDALTYYDLCEVWGVEKRTVRNILHNLSCFDNGDDLVLIRSARGCGFYKTDDKREIAEYRAELLSRGKRTLAPLRKIDRVLHADGGQLVLENNIRAMRIDRGMKQEEVCARMKAYDAGFDVSMLSRLENDRCLPTPWHLAHLASIFGCAASDLINGDLIQAAEQTLHSDLQAAENR